MVNQKEAARAWSEWLTELHKQKQDNTMETTDKTTVAHETCTPFGNIFGLDVDSETIHEILSVLHRRNLSVSRAQDILQKAERAIGLIRFSWDPTTLRIIPQ